MIDQQVHMKSTSHSENLIEPVCDYFPGVNTPPNPDNKVLIPRGPGKAKDHQQKHAKSTTMYSYINMHKVHTRRRQQNNNAYVYMHMQKEREKDVHMCLLLSLRMYIYRERGGLFLLGREL